MRLATLLQHVAVPRVAVARDLQWLQREQSQRADRSPNVTAFGEARLEVAVDWHLEPRFTRHQHSFRLNRQLELEAQQTEHVGHDRTGHARSQLMKLPAERRVLERV